jgi:hydrogenase expression/formation protein HypE
MGSAETTVQLAHGGGGRLSQQLIHKLLMPAFGPPDGVLHDAALLSSPGQTLAFTTDSYVVRPLFFPGGNIGELAIYGSVNDLAMAGAIPVAMSLGLILEEGLELTTLERVVRAIRTAADRCNVKVITGDTKVVEHGKGDGLYINTSAIGVVEHGLRIHPTAVRPGDALLVSGDLGRHGMAILIAREELGFRSTMESDLAPLHTTVQGLINAEVELHCLRDLTRGGLASAADEIARAGGYTIELEEEAVPVELEVRSACNLLGLDPLSMANEGRMLVICPASEVDKALTVLRRHNAAASKVGTLKVGMNVGQHLPVVVRNSLGILRPLDLGRGEQLPRIC